MTGDLQPAIALDTQPRRAPPAQRSQRRRPPRGAAPSHDALLSPATPRMALLLNSLLPTVSSKFEGVKPAGGAAGGGHGAGPVHHHVWPHAALERAAGPAACHQQRCKVEGGATCGATCACKAGDAMLAPSLIAARRPTPWILSLDPAVEQFKQSALPAIKRP